MRSKIYEGYVEHIRFQPVWHRLNYPLYFYCFDLEELAHLDRTMLLFGYNRFRPVSLFDSDYLNHSPGTIREKLLSYLEDAGCADKISRISMITSARYFYSVFNPVSFYYCYSADDEVLCCVAEVNNTYGERHVYIMKNEKSIKGGYPLNVMTDKAFHVSPFNDVRGTYEMSFSAVAHEIEIHVDLHRSGEKVFGAKLWGKARDFTLWNHAAILLRHPIVPHLTIPRIYLEAAKLHFKKKLKMYDKPAPISAMTIRKIPPTLIQRICLKVVDDVLARIEKDGLQLVQTGGVVLTYGEKSSQNIARVMVNDNRFYTRAVFGGEVGFGEAYVDGYWDSDDLVNLFKILIENRKAIFDGNIVASSISRMRDHALQLMRKNTLTGVRRNIARHYDLSNDFFATFLDESMSYSCGMFLSDDETLEQAQRNKMHAIIKKAAIQKDDHVLEIGCGWGGFAIEAVRLTGCSVTGITVSRQQYEYAKARIKEEGLEESITVLLKDYRDIQGRFDKIVSIEMLEAVGHEYLGTFFARCDRLLAPDGLVVLQVITIPDHRYKQHKREGNWIQKHIFPGGHLPSLTAMSDAMTAHSGLIVEDVENIGIHYVKTLQQWRTTFLDAADEVSKMGFDRSIRRKWEYYFSICEAQFATRVLSDLQIVLTRESNKRLAGP
jgi:cyclopropane-fatty-acyl-phospholipid synthase